MSDSKPSLVKAIRRHLAPVLRSEGFLGTGQRYWRVVGGQCHVIAVQGSRYGGKFAINMGIQPMSIPLRSGETPEPQRIREMECLFRRRLTLQHADQWWDYQPNQSSMDAAIRDASIVYEQIGKCQLEFMSKPDSPMNTLTPEAFASSTYDFKGFGNSAFLMAWALAHMRMASGKRAEAQGFVEVALKEIGDGPIGSALEIELRELLERIWAQAM